MKELSIEQKAQRYDEALQRAKHALDCDKNGLVSTDKILLLSIFPELKESGDEMIRKWVINEIKVKHHNLDEDNVDFVDKAIAWLEKQGEQKPVDKVEPKFKVGDWITNGRYNRLVVGVISKHYLFKDGNAKYIDDTDRKYHLWTIQDAKAGDVLYCKNCGIEYIIILKRIKNRNLDSICRYNTIDGFAIDIPNVMAIGDNPKPATKEQCDTLERAITNAGYRWDKENLKLEKMNVFCG